MGSGTCYFEGDSILTLSKNLGAQTEIPKTNPTISITIEIGQFQGLRRREKVGADLRPGAGERAGAALHVPEQAAHLPR